jgi:hypothetical protein
LQFQSAVCGFDSCPIFMMPRANHLNKNSRILAEAYVLSAWGVLHVPKAVLRALVHRGCARFCMGTRSIEPTH